MCTEVLTFLIISIHPEFDANQFKENNFAIVEIEEEFDKTTPIFSLGELKTNVNNSCTLSGWASSFGPSARAEAVTIYNPELCDSNFPQAFCTDVDSRVSPICNARLGSPVICEGESTLAGFVITDGTCPIMGNRVVLFYHSVHDFRSYIKDIAPMAGAAVPVKLSILLILSAFSISVRNSLGL